MDNEKNHDLKALISRNELTHFLDQLNAVSSVPLAIMDNTGDVIYGNKSVTGGIDISLRYPIRINDVQLGVLVGYESAILDKDKVTKTIGHAGEMLNDKLSQEQKVDSLVTEIINSYQELNLLYELSEPLSSVLDAETICDIVLKQAVGIVDPKKAFVMLLDKNNEHLSIVASTDADKSMKGMQISIQNSIYESVIRDRTSLVIEDLEKYPHLKDKIEEGNALFAAPLICVPINIKGEIFGLIIMSEKLSGKPFTSADTKSLTSIAIQTGMSLGNAKLYADLNNAFLSTVEALAAAVEAKDPYTHGHSRRVAEYAVSIAEEIGLTAKEISDLRLAGILHDVGKIGISESILRRSAGLSEEELEGIKSHSAKGAEIIENIEPMRNIACWIRYHHERYDGTGYPDGLKGEEISIQSRILAVANAYDSLTSHRSYHSKYPYDIPLVKLQLDAGSKFDPEIVNALINIIREDAYKKYLEEYQSHDYSPERRLTRVAYYRIDSDITSILTREALGHVISESEQKKLQELRELVLRC